MTEATEIAEYNEEVTRTFGKEGLGWTADEAWIAMSVTRDHWDNGFVSVVDLAEELEDIGLLPRAEMRTPHNPSLALMLSTIYDLERDQWDNALDGRL